jgi:ferredoxin-nitrite reductase
MTDTIPSSPTLNKFEKFKAEKDGLAVKAELSQFAEIGWEAMDETDRDHRLKWMGVFFRPVTPGQFMVRMRLPSGIISSSQLRVLADVVQRYGTDGCADITTRQNLQLRGVRIEDVPDIFRKFEAAGLTSIQSGMDNVRNLTGSPVAGIDADELIDTRGIIQTVQDMITNNGAGNPAFSNLPRKFNIAIGGCRDNSIHAEINDIAFIPAYKDGNLGFNVLVGGFFSAKRCAAAVPLDVWVAPDDVVALCEAILLVYRNHGLRVNRQKSRLMWLIDEWGIAKFRTAVEQQIGKTLLTAAAKDEIQWDKRDHIGVFAQKQAGLNYVGLHVPVGRLLADDMMQLARLAEVYGSGELRLTVEQNVIIVNVPDSRLAALLKETIVEKFSTQPGQLSRSLVSCTGAQFCNFALVETKNQATALIKEIEAEMDCPQPVRIHWTGCPNSCAQPQVADIGLMGTKVRKAGRTLEGVDIYMGGKVGKDAHLGACVMKSIPCEDLKPVLQNLLIQRFGARPKAGVTVAAPAVPMPAAVPWQAAPAAPPIGNGAIAFVRSRQQVVWPGETSLLEVAEQANIDIPSSCRAGNCGTCKQRLLSGEVRYDGEPTGLTAGDRDSGYILTCIAYPANAGQIEIDV